MSDLLLELKSRLQILKNVSLNTLREFRFRSDVEPLNPSLIQDVFESLKELKGYFQLKAEHARLKQEMATVENKAKVSVRTLIESFYMLEQEIDKAQASIDTADETSKSSVKELILLGLRQSGTASAPADWAYDMALPRSYRPPMPQEHEIKQSLLFTQQRQERVANPTIKVTQFPEVFRITLTCPQADSFIRYTIDNSTPSELTGKLYEGPFEFESGSEFVVKAVAFRRNMRESEVVMHLHRDENFKMPAPVEAQIERPKHILSPSGVLDLNLGLSPPSSMYSSDEEEFSSPYFSFPNK